MKTDKDRIEKVCVFGVGGVGGYFGARICEARGRAGAEKLHVSFIARGAHLQAIRQEGIKVATPNGMMIGIPDAASDSVDDVPSPDLFLLCVKSYDLEEAVRSMRQKVDKRTVISQEIARLLRDKLGASLFATSIRKNIAVEESQYAQKTIFEYAPKSTGAEDYRALAKEVTAWLESA